MIFVAPLAKLLGNVLVMLRALITDLFLTNILMLYFLDVAIIGCMNISKLGDSST